MKRRPLRTVAVASALTLGTAVAAVTSAGAATVPTASPRATARGASSSTTQPLRTTSTERAVAPVRATRTISDGAFSVSRYVATSHGTRHVVFVARNLQTGATLELTGAT